MGPGSPCLSKQGRNDPSLLGGWGGGNCMRRSLRVGVSIVAMDGLAMSITDACLSAACGAQIKRTRRPRQHSPPMRAYPRPLWHHRSDQVACLVAEMDLFALPVPDREAMLIGATHPPGAVPARYNEQGIHLARLQMLWCIGVERRRVQP